MVYFASETSLKHYKITQLMHGTPGLNYFLRLLLIHCIKMLNKKVIVLLSWKTKNLYLIDIITNK